MSREIITGLLAYGMSGKVFHAPFVAAHAGFKLHAVVERNHKNAVSDYPAVLSYDSVEALLGDAAIELVVINTPNYTHYDYAKLALTAGKHILVEKPFTATSAEALQLFALAKSVGKQIFFYQNRRWDSDYRAVCEVLNSGKLGKLSEVHFRYDRYRSTIGPKSFKETPMAASGLMYDLGPHLLDQAISYFGEPLSFHKILGKNRVGTQVDDYFSIHLQYADSLNVFVHANMMVVDPLPAFVINGTNGSLQKVRADSQEEQLLKGMKPGDEGYGIEPEGSAGKLTLIDVEGHKTTSEIPSLEGNYLPLFEAVYQSVVNDAAFPVTEAQVLSQLAILEA